MIIVDCVKSMSYLYVIRRVGDAEFVIILEIFL